MKSTTIVLLFIIMLQREVLSCGQLQTTLIPLLTNTHATHRWPWHVAIYHETDENDSEYKCGGTLISASAILTAAHCVSVNAEHVTISLGRLRLDDRDSNTPMKVAEIIRHPDYHSENFKNDIAIIVLVTNVIFNSYVQPVCLWKAEKFHSSEIVGEYGTVVGWGRTETGEISNVLRHASLPVVDTFTCLESNSDLFGRFLSRTNFCAGTRNGTSVCTGDSGGSMTFQADGKYYIRGVVSVGPSKIIHSTQEVVCDPQQYALFTDVAPFLPWIRKSASIVDCEKRVRCNWSEDNRHCTAALHITDGTADCRVIFDETSDPEVTTLELSGSYDAIPEISDAAAKFRNLNIIWLRNISLKTVQRQRIAPFTNIEQLGLSSNSLSQLNADSFDDLSNLVQLGLYDNDLTVLPAGIFHNNRRLQRLGLHENRLRKLPTDLFKELTNLEVLFLRDNSLESLPAGIFHYNVKLRRLELQRNQLKELQADLFKQLTNLEILYLFNNRLESLPARIFRNNGKLVDLNIGHNQLKEIQADLFQELYNLKDIRIYENQIEAIPAGLFRNNKKLTVVFLSYNHIKIISPDFHQTDIETIYDFRENVCVNASCGVSDDSCDALSLAKIFDEIRKNC